MRKLTLLVAALALSAMPSVADAKKARKHAAPKPAPVAQEAPGAPAFKVMGGFFNEVSKIGQPPAPAPAKGKKS